MSKCFLQMLSWQNCHFFWEIISFVCTGHVPFILLDCQLTKWRGHKFGKIVRWLLFMLCPQSNIGSTMCKTLPSFVEGKQRESNTVWRERERDICNQEKIGFKFLANKVSEKLFASLLVSATMSWAQHQSGRICQFVWKNLSAISRWKIVTMKSKMTLLRGFSSLISIHSIKTYELLHFSKYKCLASLRTHNNFQKWPLSMSLQIYWPGSFMGYMNVFTQVHL